MFSLLFVFMFIYIIWLRKQRKKLNQILFAMIGVNLEEKRHRLLYHRESKEVLDKCEQIIAPYESFDFYPKQEDPKIVSMIKARKKKEDKKQEEQQEKKGS